MAIDVTEIQNRIASMVDQSSSAPSEGSDDWNTRLKYINIAQSEWEQLYDWPTLYREYNTKTSTVSGNTSISMPADFRKLGGFPRIAYSGGEMYEFQEVSPQERTQKNSSDRYVYFLSNASNSVMVVNPVNSNGQLASGASITIPYYAVAASLVSGCDSSSMPDVDYLVKRSISMVWEGRGDDRFPEAKAEAKEVLRRMLERENVASVANTMAGRIRTVEETRYNFRLGRD